MLPELVQKFRLLCRLVHQNIQSKIRLSGGEPDLQPIDLAARTPDSPNLLPKPPNPPPPLFSPTPLIPFLLPTIFNPTLPIFPHPPPFQKLPPPIAPFFFLYLSFPPIADKIIAPQPPAPNLKSSCNFFVSFVVLHRARARPKPKPRKKAEEKRGMTFDSSLDIPSLSF